MAESASDVVPPVLDNILSNEFFRADSLQPRYSVGFCGHSLWELLLLLIVGGDLRSMCGQSISMCSSIDQSLAQR